MNSEYDNQIDEPDTQEMEATDEHVEHKPARPSWPIRITQCTLTAVLIGIVAHGLLTRTRESADRPARHGTRTLRDAEAGESATTAVAQTVRPAASSINAPTVPATAVSALENNLNSLHDIRDYLELHRVRRETRAYELGLTSRNALVQMALTSEPKR